MNVVRLALIGALLASLIGCGGGDFSDLQTFINQERAKPRPPIEPLPSFEAYAPFTYDAMTLRSPFQPPMKLELADRIKGSKDIQPDEHRAKQFLEGFSIDSFEMVGTLSKNSELYALLSGAGGVHRVKIGDYLGLNYGRIVLIDADKLDVVEIVPDGQGGWLERPRSLLLRERS